MLFVKVHFQSLVIIKTVTVDLYLSGLVLFGVVHSGVVLKVSVPILHSLLLPTG